MAKRYKEKERKKNKIKYFLLIIILTIIFISAIGRREIVEVVNEEVEQEIINQIKEEEEKEKLKSNLLVPKKLIKEITKMQAENMECVKIHYKLESLKSGNIDIYYKINNTKLIKIVVNIENKIIESIEEYNNQSLLAKDEITNNLNEDIKEDFNKRESKLKDNNIINIIITNTEVLINIGYN